MKLAADEDPGRSLSDADWTARYEDLRQQVLEQHRSVGGGWGLAGFIHRGLVAWMRAWPPLRSETACVWKAFAGEPRTRGEVSDQRRLPSSLNRQVAMVLVSMILNTRQEVIA